jgi:hypothetical protein
MDMYFCHKGRKRKIENNLEEKVGMGAGKS